MADTKNKAQDDIVISRAKANASGMAVVKGVSSGDQIIVMGGAKSGAIPPSKPLILSGISAPRLGRGKSGVDEPFAWAAREFLRNLCIGKTVYFSVNYVNASGREYADVSVGKHRVNLSHELVRNGYAKVNTNRDGTVHPDKQEIFDLMERAQALGVGMWATDVDPEEYVRKVNYSEDSKAFAFLKANKGRILKGIVEYVRDGSTARVELLDPLGKLNHRMIQIHFSGIQCPDSPPNFKYLMEQYKAKKAANPDFKGNAPTKKEKKPFSAEAKHFTEARLLNRNCKVILQSVDAWGNLFGTILLPQGNVVLRLLECGLGKMVKWTGRMTPDYNRMNASQDKAQKARIGVWKVDTPVEEPPLPANFIGTVVFVNSGDSVTVNDGKVDHKLSLASVRAPRSSRGRKEEEFAFDAREFVRRKLIGKRVNVEYQYTRTAPPAARDQGLRYFVSLYFSKSNVGADLVNAGLATVVRHRRDEIRSTHFEQLFESEMAAKAAGKKIHCGKPQGTRVVVDLSFRPRRGEKKDAPDFNDEGEVVTSKARGFLTHLKNKQELRGVVEHVFSATRFKVLVPSENLMITFLLAGCRMPHKEDDTDGLWAAESLLLAKNKLLQHDVTLKVENMDRGDNFVGILNVGKQNFNNTLMRTGLIDMFRFSAEQSSGYHSLVVARDEAKAAKRNFWHDWEEKQAARMAKKNAVLEAQAGAEAKADALKIKEGNVINVSVCEVVDACNFYVTVDGNPEKELLDAKMAELTLMFNDEEAAAADAEADVDAEVKATDDAEEADEEEYDEDEEYVEDDGIYRGEVVAGQYEDGTWHRVKLEQGNAKKGWKVQFIDFGNYDELSHDAVRLLPDDVMNMRPLARLCSLTCCDAPTRKSEHFIPAGEMFTNYSFEQKLVAKVDMVDRNDVLHLTLSHAEPDQDCPGSINTWMLKDGYCRLGKFSRSTKNVYELLQADEDVAKRAHLNIWEYGDVSDGEDDANERWGGGRVPSNKQKALVAAEAAKKAAALKKAKAL